MSGIDRISELPEPLLIQILSYLPTKDSVKTSVLTTTWKNHWLNVPVLELNYSDFPYDKEQVYTSFMDMFLELNSMPRLQKVKVKTRDVAIDGFRDRIATAINRGIHHLDVESSVQYLEVDVLYPFREVMPLNIYTSKTLVSLMLSYSGLDDSDFVSLPCFKFMHLTEIKWVGNMTLEKLVSGCPVLEELTLLRDLRPDITDLHDVTRVRSPCLKSFCVLPVREYSCSSRLEYILEIDAPKLEYMSFKEDHYDRIVVKNLNSLFSVDLDIKFAIKLVLNLPKRNEIRDFLTGITSVRHMIISQLTVKVLDFYSKLALIPKFNNLSRLQAVFPSSSLQFLHALLESCPNLKHLIWKIVYSKETEPFQVINVPQCFVTTLECVEIEGFFDWEEEKKKIVSYFIKNTVVLKKLVLRFAHTRQDCVTDSSIYEDLNKLTKRSQGCQILIENEAL